MTFDPTDADPSHYPFPNGAELMDLGSRLWPIIRAGAKDKDEVVQRLLEFCTKRGGLFDTGEFKTLALFAADWAHGAFPKMVTTHKYAAALMCTRVTPEIASDLHVPWTAFAVHIPDALIRTALGEYTRIYVHSSGLPVAEGRALVFTIWGQRVRMIETCLRPEELFAPDKEDIVDASVSEEQASAMHLARRLVAGLLLAMQHTDNFKARGPTSFGSSSRRGEPEHRVVFIGKPISVDCRAAVRSYLDGNGKGAPPSVQTIVRGHFKRQVLGVGRAGRRVIWIEPYWRGPEDAPILSRPYHVGPKA